MSKSGIVGVSDHGGWAVLVTADRAGRLLDRRRVALVDEGLPRIPHHSEAQRLPLAEAIELIERVHASAERHATRVLEVIATEVPATIRGVALRACPTLPPTIAERITNYRAQNVADWVMYRRALAAPAEARGWPVHWYDARQVQEVARQVLGVERIEAHFAEVRRSCGPPWNEDHKTAMGAAIAAMAALAGRSL